MVVLVSRASWLQGRLIHSLSDRRVGGVEHPDVRHLERHGLRGIWGSEILRSAHGIVCPAEAARFARRWAQRSSPWLMLACLIGAGFAGVVAGVGVTPLSYRLIESAMAAVSLPLVACTAMGTAVGSTNWWRCRPPCFRRPSCPWSLHLDGSRRCLGSIQ